MHPDQSLTASPSVRGPWKPARHTVFLDEALGDRIHQEGFAVVPFVNAAQVRALNRLFRETHQIPRDNGGLFYSVYSRDFDYRARVDREVRAILGESFERYFGHYENVINMFVVKVPGPASEFPIHQDTTALDETLHSPLNVWVPLSEIRRENGALAVVRRTHHLSSPYRGISFEPQYSKVLGLVRRFLEPVEVPLGQAVLFDARMLHCSLENRTEEDRAVVVSGIFPQGSEIVTCFREPQPEAAIELLRQPPEFLLRFPNFLHDCHARPAMGEVVGTVPAPQVPQPMTEGEFLAACRLLGIEARDEMPPAPGPRCHMIGEPR